MRLVTNSVSPNQVEETTDKYIIRDVPFIRPMRLSGGYTPSWSVKETANQWDGVPATLNHPRDNSGTPVPAERQPETHLGTVKNPEFDGTHVRGDIELNKSDLSGGEAADIREALENGQTINVSSQYRPQELPPGEYDGEYRDEVERIIEPDSVAILPNKTGVCSPSNGKCGINPEKVAANSEVSLTATSDDPVSPEDGQGEDSRESQNMHGNASVDGITYDGVATGSLDESEIPTEEFEPHYVFDGDTKTESSYPLVDADGRLRRGNVSAAFELYGRAPNPSKLLSVLDEVNGEFDTPPIDDDTLQDAIESVSSNSVGGLGRVLSFLGLTESASDESGGTPGTEPTTTNTTTSMSDKTAELVANHGFDAENLPSEDTECFTRIYEAVTSNDNDNDDDEQTSNGEEYVTESDLAEFKDDLVSELSANEDASEKTALAEEIVANSAEYDDTESVTEDYPTTAALKAKRDTLTQDSGVLPGVGQTANMNLDGGDEFADVSPGVLD